VLVLARVRKTLAGFDKSRPGLIATKRREATGGQNVGKKSDRRVMTINWHDPAERFALIGRVGVAEYTRQRAEHMAQHVAEQACPACRKPMRVVGIDAATPYKNARPARFDCDCGYAQYALIADEE
jgi:hypothetical protein